MTASLVIMILSFVYTQSTDGLRTDDPKDRPVADRNETFQELKLRTLLMVLTIDPDPKDTKATSLIRVSSDYDELKKSVDSYLMAEVNVNPESRVKIKAYRDRIQLVKDRPQRFLIHIENMAGITAPLRIRPIDLSKAGNLKAKWCRLKLVEDQSVSQLLTGALHEYKIIELTVSEEGHRELRLIADAGQGTQDLGFRATADILLDIAPSTSEK